MNAKQQTGEFSHKFSTMGVNPGPAGSLTAWGNLEGSASGFSSVISSMTASPAGGKSGTFTWDGIAFMDNGESTTAHLSGTFVSSGKESWKTVGAGQFADGRRATMQGEISLATRMWSGTFTMVD